MNATPEGRLKPSDVEHQQPRRLPKGIVDRLGLKPSPIHMYDSFAQDCIFYYTPIDGVLLTNFDIASGGAVDITNQRTWYVLLLGKGYVLVTFELLEDTQPQILSMIAEELRSKAAANP